MLLLLLLLLTDATATATAPAAASATATAATSEHTFFNEERKTGGVVRKRLEDRWLLHDETTTSIYENSAGF